jgi:hypothetical protein
VSIRRRRRGRMRLGGILALFLIFGERPRLAGSGRRPRRPHSQTEPLRSEALETKTDRRGRRSAHARGACAPRAFPFARTVVRCAGVNSLRAVVLDLGPEEWLHLNACLTCP